MTSARKLIEVKHLPLEDHVYVLSVTGAQRVAIQAHFRLTRRTMVHLSRRALIAGLSLTTVRNPMARTAK